MTETNVTKEMILKAIDTAYSEYSAWTSGRLTHRVAEELGVPELTPDHGFIQAVVQGELYEGDYTARRTPHEFNAVWERR